MRSTSLRTWLRRVALLGLLGAIAGLITAQALRSIALRRGVTIVQLPAQSLIREMAAGANYVDAYRVPVQGGTTLDDLGFGGGTEVARTAEEVIWEGKAPGLRFFAAYHLHEGVEGALTLSTAVFYESWLGRAYFFPVGFVHRRIVPFALSREAAR